MRSVIGRCRLNDIRAVALSDNPYFYALKWRFGNICMVFVDIIIAVTNCITYALSCANTQNKQLGFEWFGEKMKKISVNA